MNLNQARGVRVAHWLRHSWLGVRMQCFQWEIHFFLSVPLLLDLQDFSGVSQPLFFTIIHFCAGYFIVILAAWTCVIDIFLQALDL